MQEIVDIVEEGNNIDEYHTIVKLLKQLLDIKRTV